MRNPLRLGPPTAPVRKAMGAAFVFLSVTSIAFASVLGAAEEPPQSPAQEQPDRRGGIEIGPDTTAPRLPARPRRPALARPPDSPAPAAQVDVDSIRQRIEEERENLVRQEERLRRLEAQLRRDRVILPRDTDDGGGDLPSSGDGALVRMGQDVEVREGEVVREVVVMGGDLVVRGEVEGDAVAIGGDLTVVSGGKVAGSAVTVGGRLDIEPDAIVEGDQVEVGAFGAGIPGLGRWGGNGDHDPSGIAGRGEKLVGGFVALLAFLLVGWIAAFLFGDRLRRVADFLQHNLGRSLLVGFLVLILWLPTVVLTCITVIGIPVGIFLLMAIPFAFFVGGLIGAMVLGRRIAAGFVFEQNSALAHLLIGITGIGAFLLLGSAVGLVRVLSPLATALCAIGGLLIVLAVLTGVGALASTVFENLRTKRRSGETPPASSEPGGGPGTTGGSPGWTPPAGGESTGEFVPG